MWAELTVEDHVGDEWRTVDHATGYLARADALPHRAEGERVLLEHVPAGAGRILDLGTGDGRLLALVRIERPGSTGVALDFSDTMLESASRRFAKDAGVEIVKHDLRTMPLPARLGRFDAVISSFAIHHLPDEKKVDLYREIFDRMNPGGVFCNLEHVASPTEALHRRFLGAIGMAPETEDRSNRLVEVETQLGWLRRIGFDDVDCYWKWLELTLLIGYKKP